MGNVQVSGLTYFLDIFRLINWGKVYSPNVQDSDIMEEADSVSNFVCILIPWKFFKITFSLNLILKTSYQEKNNYSAGNIHTIALDIFVLYLLGNNGNKFSYSDFCITS